MEVVVRESVGDGAQDGFFVGRFGKLKHAARGPFHGEPGFRELADFAKEMEKTCTRKPCGTALVFCNHGGEHSGFVAGSFLCRGRMSFNQSDVPAALGESVGNGGACQSGANDCGRALENGGMHPAPAKDASCPEAGLGAGDGFEPRIEKIRALGRGERKRDERGCGGRESGECAEREIRGGAGVFGGNQKCIGLQLGGENLEGTKSESQNDASLFKLEPMKTGDGEWPLGMELCGQFVLILGQNGGPCVLGDWFS